MLRYRMWPAVASLLGLVLAALVPGLVQAEEWRLGVKMFAVPGGGVKIAEVIDNSPAAEIGLQPGNLISDPAQAREKIFSAGNSIDIVYKDGDDFYQITAQLVSQTYAATENGKTVEKKKLVPKGQVTKKKVSDPRKKD